MLTESMEDYLEMIFRLVREKGYIRPVDLAEALGVQPSSVTRMVQKLHEEGFIRYEKYRHMALTEKGERVGYFLVWRDAMLKEFLNMLDARVGVEEQVEGIEHYITPPTMCLFRNLVHYFRAHPEHLSELRAMNQSNEYPRGERLEDLRAWLFRHDSE